MKTTIYIDGYNLYYGCLKHTKYKWLDLYELFASHIIRVQSPSSTVTKIKYFTADIRAKVASRGTQATTAQDSYHRALLTLYPDKVEIIKGYYSLEKASLLKYKKPPDKRDRIDVWRLEEKQTDVNIALHAYRDAIRKECEQIVIVSNDTDLKPLLQMIRKDMGQNIIIGVVIPILKKSRRPANRSLSNIADWTRNYILEDELKRSQLSNPIPTRKKPIKRPDYW